MSNRCQQAVRPVSAWAACVVLIASSSAFSMDCLDTASVSASPLVSYDPFNPSNQTSSAFTVSVIRAATTTDAPHVRSVDIQWVDTNSSEGNASIGSSGLTDVEITGGGSQLLRGGAANFSAGFMTIAFGATTSTATSAPMVLAAPGSLDIGAGFYSEAIDLAYRCNMSDGSTSNWTRSGVALMRADVANLVRAVAVGGTVPSSLLMDPDRLEASGGLAIRSTGPFSASATSANGFKLRAGGIGLGVGSDQFVSYSFSVEGKELNAPGSHYTCPRSGIGGTVLSVKSRVTSEDRSLRSGVYSDIVTVTVTPVAFIPAGCI